MTLQPIDITQPPNQDFRQRVTKLLFSLTAYPDESQRLLAQTLYVMTWLLIPVVTLLQFVVIMPGDPPLPLIEFIWQEPSALLGVTLIYSLLVGTYVLTRIGRVQMAGWVMTLGGVIAVGLIGLRTDINATSGAAIFGVLIILAALVNGVRGLLIIGVAIIALIQGLFVLAGSLPVVDALRFSLNQVLYMVVAYLMLRYAQASRQTGRDTEIEQRLRLAEINTQIIRQVSSSRSMRDTLDQVLARILANYPQMYHAQVFLVDEADPVTARLVASTGEVGDRLLAREHSLAVGSLSVVGQTLLKGRPHVAQADEDETILRFNELLPATLLEAAFPLRSDDKVIGVLDLQSRTHQSLEPAELATYQAIADSLSLVLDNLHQFETVQQQIEEKQMLAEQARSALREIERLNKRIIGRAWSEYLTMQDVVGGINLDLQEGEPEPDNRWTATLADAAQSNTIIHADNVIAVPLRVRGQVIGAMEFELDSSGSFSPEDLELIQEISERFGLAAENVRLLDESQRFARRESVINAIASRLQGTTNVEATLAEAARSLYETLQATRVTLRLGLPDNLPEPAHISTNGSNSSRAHIGGNGTGSTNHEVEGPS